MQVFPFVTTLNFLLESEQSSLSLMSGRFRHMHHSSIEIGRLGDSNELNLGCLFMSAESSVVIAETRAKFETTILPPEIEHTFTFELPLEIYSDKPFRMFFDLVYENLFWFRERQQAVPVIIDCEPHVSTDKTIAAAKALPGLSKLDLDEEADSEEEVLKELHSAFDFRGYAAIAFLIDEHYIRKPNNIKSNLDEVLNEIVAGSDDPIPITSIARHMQIMADPAKSFIARNRGERFQAMRIAFAKLVELGEDPNDYIPEILVDYLNKRMLDDGIFCIPFTRVMLWFWLAEGRKIEAVMATDAEAIAWWWVTGAVPANSLPAILIDEQTREVMTALSPAYRNRICPLSVFFVKAHSESLAMKKRYDLATDNGLLAYAFDNIINNNEHRINKLFVAKETRDFWSSIINQFLGVSRFEYFLYLLISEKSNIRSRKSQDLKSFIRARIGSRLIKFPFWSEFSSKRLDPGPVNRKVKPQKNNNAPLVAIYGMFESQSGLGVNARMSKTTFESAGIRAFDYDVDRNFWLNAAPNVLLSHALYHVNADAMPSVLLREKSRTARSLYRIGFYLWELDVVPESHYLGCSMVDEIWCPSSFVADIYSHYSSRPVRLCKKYIHLPEFRRFNLDTKRRFRFLLSFDFHSGVERKNPLAAVRAFVAAFGSSDDVELVVKITEIVVGHWSDPHDQWRQIREIAARDQRIRLVIGIFKTQELFQLFDSADCIVSTHRAEGFGYLPAYGMLLEKAVIVTDYSGTTDFCNQNTAYCVSFKRKGLLTNEFICDVRGATWADIDFEDLVSQYRLVFDDTDLRIKRAAAGFQLVSQEYSLSSQVERYRALIRGTESIASEQPK